MIAVGNGVCSNELVSTSQPYLARIDKRYLVVTPIDPTGAGRDELRYMEAVFIDPLDRQQHSFSVIHDICPIF